MVRNQQEKLGKVFGETLFIWLERPRVNFSQLQEAETRNYEILRTELLAKLIKEENVFVFFSPVMSSNKYYQIVAAYLFDELELIWDLLLRLPLPLPLLCD